MYMRPFLRGVIARQKAALKLFKKLNMYTITITNTIPANEIEELIKMFVPKGEYELNVEEALANAQSFSVVFEEETISRPVTEFRQEDRPLTDKKELKNRLDEIEANKKKAEEKRLAKRKALYEELKKEFENHI